jgi:AcrR family transcriptional regulator
MSLGPSAQRSAHPGTRDLLIDAGERLFAERGIHAVSLREIGLAAGQRNNGATQYHFGDKSGLVLAIFERRSADVNARRLALLDQVLAGGTTTVRDLIWAWVVPLAEQIERQNAYVRFLSRLQTDGDRDVLLAAQGDVSTAYQRIGRLIRQRHLNALPRELFWNRWALAINVAIAALAEYQAGTSRVVGRQLPLDVFVPELIDALAGLLMAPSTLSAFSGFSRTGQSVD